MLRVLLLLLFFALGGREYGEDTAPSKNATTLSHMYPDNIYHWEKSSRLEESPTSKCFAF